MEEETRCDPGCEPPPPPILPPTISGSLNCNSWGSNGWCTDDLALELSASDPQGETVIISGDVDGNMFACPSGDITCSVSLANEDAGTVNYIVNSATGLSDSDSTNYKLDRSSPQIDGSLTGIHGSNGWYVSDVNLNASASDPTSGVASFEMTIDGGSTTAYSDTTFTDGVHTVLLSATDQAGNYTESTQTFSIDTITPNLNVSINGTTGSDGWYSSSAQVSASASDAGSGLDQIEASKDGGAYANYTSPLTFTDGPHTYQFKTTDMAGNVTQTPEQEISVDATGPAISLVEEISLGETLYYEIQDDGSGLSTIRFVIGDEKERFEKVAWEDSISGNYHDGGILWDGKFKDGTKAPIGSYYISISAMDKAGNESRKAGWVTVDFFSFLQNIPPFNPSPVPWTPSPSGRGEGEGASSPSTGFGGTVSPRDDRTYTKTDFRMSSATNPLTSSNSDNILWGAAAAAAVGAFLAEAQRKREEEKARQAAASAAGSEQAPDKHPAPLSYRQRARAYQASLNNYVSGLLAQGFTPEEANRKKRQAIQSGSIPPVASTVANRDRTVAMETKMARMDTADEAKWLAMKEAEEAKQAQVNAADAARWAGMAALAQEAARLDDDPPNWWEKTKEKLDNYVDKWTAISLPVDLFEPPKWLNTVSPLIRLPVEYLDFVADSSAPVPSDSKIVNALKNMTSYTRGVTTQFADDMSVGLFSWFTGLQPDNGDQFFQEGRQLGRTLSTLLGATETVAGLALFATGISLIPPTTGGTVACAATTGPGAVLCIGVGGFALVGETSAVAGGSILAGHGAMVSIRNHNTPVNGGETRVPVPGKNNTYFRSSKTQPGANREYEVRVTGKPDPDLAIDVNGTEFDWYEGDTLIDAKNAGETRSWFDVSKSDKFTLNVKIPGIEKQAWRQVNAARGTGFTNIEWRVADEKAANALMELFSAKGIPIDVIWIP